RDHAHRAAVHRAQLVGLAGDPFGPPTPGNSRSCCWERLPPTSRLIPFGGRNLPPSHLAQGDKTAGGLILPFAFGSGGQNGRGTDPALRLWLRGTKRPRTAPWRESRYPVPAVRPRRGDRSRRLLPAFVDVGRRTPAPAARSGRARR